MTTGWFPWPWDLQCFLVFHHRNLIQEGPGAIFLGGVDSFFQGMGTWCNMVTPVLLDTISIPRGSSMYAFQITLVSFRTSILHSEYFHRNIHPHSTPSITDRHSARGGALTMFLDLNGADRRSDTCCPHTELFSYLMCGLIEFISGSDELIEWLEQLGWSDWLQHYWMDRLNRLSWLVEIIVLTEWVDCMEWIARTGQIEWFNGAC
jgi:hypothetical protein